MRAQYKFLIILSLVFVFIGSIMVSEQSWASRFDSGDPVTGNLNVKVDFALEDRSEMRVAGGDFGDKRFKDKDFKEFFDDDRRFFKDDDRRFFEDDDDEFFKVFFFDDDFRRPFRKPFRRPFRRGFRFKRD